MSRIVLITAAALIVLMAILSVTIVTLSQPTASAQKHNAYWPYSVELVVRDK